MLQSKSRRQGRIHACYHHGSLKLKGQQSYPTFLYTFFFISEQIFRTDLKFSLSITKSNLRKTNELLSASPLGLYKRAQLKNDGLNIVGLLKEWVEWVVKQRVLKEVEMVVGRCESHSIFKTRKVVCPFIFCAFFILRFSLLDAIKKARIRLQCNLTRLYK